MKLTKARRAVIDEALYIIRENVATYGDLCSSPQKARNIAILQLALEEREHFLVMFLSSQHRLIKDEILFSGTINAASVYPREIVKRALYHNAAAVIFAHNHPSGNTDPSQADISITRRLKEALALIDVSVLDHIIIGGSSDDVISMAEIGML